MKPRSIGVKILAQTNPRAIYPSILASNHFYPSVNHYAHLHQQWGHCWFREEWQIWYVNFPWRFSPGAVRASDGGSKIFGRLARRDFRLCFRYRMVNDWHNKGVNPSAVMKGHLLVSVGIRWILPFNPLKILHQLRFSYSYYLFRLSLQSWLNHRAQLLTLSRFVLRSLVFVLWCWDCGRGRLLLGRSGLMIVSTSIHLFETLLTVADLICVGAVSLIFLRLHMQILTESRYYRGALSAAQ